MRLVADRVDVECRHHDRARVRRFNGCPTDEIHAAHTGQMHVRHEHVDGCFAQNLTTYLGVFREQNVVTMVVLVKESMQRKNDPVLVVDDKHSLATLGHGCSTYRS